VATKPSDPDPQSAFPRSTTILLALGGATVTAFGVAAIRDVFVPVFLGFVLTVCVDPLRHWMQGHGIRRGFATATTILAVFGLLTAIATVLIAALAQFSALLPQFAPQVNQLGSAATELLESAGFPPGQTQTVQEGLTPDSIIGFVGGLLGNITNIIGALVVLLTMLILMAVDGSHVSALLTYLNHHRPALVSAFKGFGVGVRRYMVATTVLGLAQGLFNWLVLVLLQVPGAFLWGLLSFICSYVPNVGYFIAIIPPIFFGFLSGGWPTAAAVILIYGVTNGVIQSLIQPKYIGNVVSLSETLTFVSVLFWALILGPMGAILAVPLTLLVRTVLIDAEPSTSWRRPLTGDKSALEDIIHEEDSEIRSRRTHRSPRHMGKAGTGGVQA
jgi:AI-2 transport protein TqsA